MPAALSEGESATTVAAVPVGPALPPDESVTHRCANCLTPLTGPFCSQCGQHVADYHRSLWRFVTEFFENTFCWDSKLLRTLDPLLKRPGWLTQEFMAGRRVRYVHPLRLFLFTSAICLTLIQYVHRDAGKHVPTHGSKDPKPGMSIQTGDDKDGDEDEKKSADSSTPAPAASSLPSEPAVSPPAPAVPTTPAEPTLGQVFRDTYKAGAKGQQAGPGDDFQKKMEEATKKMEEAGKKMGAAGKTGAFRERIATNIQQKLSWMTLAMLPIFAVLMRWSYGRRGGYYFTYLVFSLHYHTFLLLFWVAYSLLDALANRLNPALFQLPGFFVGLCLLLPPFYLYKALRRMYGQSRFATAVKVSVIGTCHLLALFVGMAIIDATSFL